MIYAHQELSLINRFINMQVDKPSFEQDIQCSCPQELDSDHEDLSNLTPKKSRSKNLADNSSDQALRSKRGQKKAKKDQKALEMLKEIMYHLQNGALEQSLDLLIKNLSWMINLLPQKDFMGVGNVENWNGLCPQGPRQWFGMAEITGWLRGNLYDYVSFCVAAMIGIGRSPEPYITWYQHQLTFSPYKFEVLMGLGNLHYNCNQWHQAQKYYLQASKLGNKKVWEYLAWIYTFHYHNDDKGRQYVQKSLVFDPLNFYSQFILAECQPTASKICEALLSLILDAPSYYRSHANYIFYQRSHNQKPQFVEYCLKLDPKFIHLGVARGLQFERDNNFEKAGEIYQQMMREHPNHPQSYYYYGCSLVKAKKLDKAKEALKTCLCLCPEYGRAYYKISSIAKEQGNKQESQSILEKGVTKCPNNAEIWNCLGNLHSQNSKSSVAKEYYIRANELEPRCTWYRFNLALCFYKLNNYEASFENFHRLHSNTADFLSADELQLVCKIAHKVKNYDYAEKVALQCIDKGGDSEKKIYSRLSSIYLQQSQFNQAIKWKVQAIKKCGATDESLLKGPEWQRLHKDQKKNILIEVYETEVWGKVAIYLPFGKMFESVGLNALAVEVYTKCLILADGGKCQVSSSQRRELDRMFGRNSDRYPRLMKGKICRFQNLKHLMLKEQFEQIYASMYTQALVQGIE